VSLSPSLCFFARSVYEEDTMIRHVHPSDRARLITIYIAVCTVSVMIFLLTCFRYDNVYGAEKGYTIQLGAYQDIQAAKEKVNELNRLGHNATFHKEATQGKEFWYRIYIERFSSREAAEKEARILKELGLISAYFVRSLPSESRGKQNPDEKDSPAYYLRVGSFKKKENAEKLVQDILGEGQNAMRVREEVSGEGWFRVYIGGYGDETEANKVGSQLKKKGLISGFRTLLMEKEPFVGSAKGSKP